MKNRVFKLIATLNISVIFMSYSVLANLICEPARVAFTTSNLTDHMSTTYIDNILESRVHKVSLSGHYMVFRKRRRNAEIGGGHKMVITRNK